jgi:kynurenine formamidase
VACGGDSTAFEQIPPGVGHSLLPAHLALIVDAGIHIIEHMNLEGLSDSGAIEFTFVMLPLRLTGVTGSPVRPVAVLSK